MHSLVTGAAGHLGLNVVRTLQAHGYRVRAAVRSLADTTRTAPLREIEGVELVEADVRDATAMRAACDGIDTLFHVAAVFSTTERGRDAEILETAVRGAETALRAAADANVRQVVLTSSVVTLPLRNPGHPPSTEADWTTDLRVPYFRAKVESERRAWELSRELGLPLVTILPAGIIGPGFSRMTPTLDLIEAALLGEFRFAAPRGNYSFVDSRDVAAAHVLAAEQGARGRFIVGYERAPSFRELVEAIRVIEPSVRLPLMELPARFAPLLPLYDAFSHRVFGTPRTATPDVIATAVSGRMWSFSCARAHTELGWAPSSSFEESLRETVTLLRARRSRR